MKKSKFTEQRIAVALQRAEGGVSVEEEVCRKMGVSQGASAGGRRSMAR